MNDVHGSIDTHQLGAQGAWEEPVAWRTEVLVEGQYIHAWTVGPHRPPPSIIGQWLVMRCDLVLKEIHIPVHTIGGIVVNPMFASALADHVIAAVNFAIARTRHQRSQAEQIEKLSILLNEKKAELVAAKGRNNVLTEEVAGKARVVRGRLRHVLGLIGCGSEPRGSLEERIERLVTDVNVLLEHVGEKPVLGLDEADFNALMEQLGQGPSAEAT